MGHVLFFYLSETFSYVKKEKTRKTNRKKMIKEIRVFPRAEELTPIFKLKWSQNGTNKIRPILPIIVILKKL